MKKLGGWLIVIGILVSLPYMIYVSKFSGKKLDSYPIKLGIGGQMGGKMMGVSKGQDSKRIGPLSLSPEMNPIRVNLNVHYDSLKSSGLLFNYDVRVLNQEGDQLLKKSARYSATSNKDKEKAKGLGTLSLGTFEILNSDDYFILANIKEAPSVRLHSASIELRRNVVIMNPIIPGTGGGLFLLGMILAYAGRKKK